MTEKKTENKNVFQFVLPGLPGLRSPDGSKREVIKSNGKKNHHNTDWPKGKGGKGKGE